MTPERFQKNASEAMTARSTIAHYKVTAKVGEGGMGAVYRATDTRLNREVAIKVLPESFVADPDRLIRFTREAQVLASLNHPNIAAIYGVEERALVLELVEGPTLAERIAQGPIPLDEALPIARQIAEALEYAHEKQIIHRDLKPANVKITPEGRVKVLDFGLAKALTEENAAADPASSPTLTMRATMAGVIMGTAGYMSPEQARGQNADRRADIWSFGVVLYEMLTGRQMFPGDTVSDALAAVLKTDPDWSGLPADTHPAVRRLLRRCLERDRKRRLTDIGGARLEIDEALLGAQEAAASPVAAPQQPRRLVTWWNIAASTLILAGAAIAVLHFRETNPEPGMVRFEIPPPAGDYANGGMALSPDGRRLAFVAITGEGRSMLWVRSLDSLDARALPGTEGVGFLPFWSPDSRFIAFGVQQTLKKVAAAGGPSQKLAEIPGAVLGGSWNREGTIIFGSNATGLYRVSQAGGVATQVTTSDPAHGEIGHLRPWFLPDGRHFLYVTRMSNAQDCAIYLASLDGGARKRLVASQQAGAYAPPMPGAEHGYLLFLRDGTLMAQPMRSSNFDLTGEPFPVADKVGAVLAMGFFSVSANGVLVFRGGGEFGFGSSHLGWFDRAGKPEGTLGPPARYVGSLSLSPDGQRVAVEQTDSTGNRDIWIMDVARGVPSRFTFTPYRDAEPVWSPDGSRLVFSSNAEGIPAIYQKSSSGSGTEELLLKGAMPLWPSAWSPDGQRLLYSATDAKNRSDLWVLSLSPAGATPVPYLQTPFGEQYGQFSPDGKWVAYVSDESGQYEVFVQSFPVGGGKFQISTGGGQQPRWRRDGKELFYIAADGKMMAVDVKMSPRFQSGSPQPLFDSRAMPTNALLSPFRYDVTADGKRFLINTISGTTEKAGPMTVVLNWQAGIRK